MQMTTKTAIMRVTILSTLQLVDFFGDFAVVKELVEYTFEDLHLLVIRVEKTNVNEVSQNSSC